MAFADKDSFLDGLFDHIFGTDGEVDDEDQKWFDEKVIPFFDQFEENKGGNSGTNSPRRKRPESNSGGGSGTSHRRRQGNSSSQGSHYGSTAFFGQRG
jgi:hypothetical protein